MEEEEGEREEEEVVMEKDEVGEMWVEGPPQRADPGVRRGTGATPVRGTGASPGRG